MEEEQLTNRSVPATSLLPIEIWSGIFEKLKTSPKTILSCREACVEFKNEVDRKMISWVKPTELDQLPIDKIRLSKLSATKIFSRLSMTEFQEEMKGHGGNPFPTRILGFHPTRCYHSRNFCGECLPYFKDVYFRLFQFSERFGMHVHNLGVTVVNRSSMTQMKKSLFINFPHLRQLEVKMVKIGTLWRSYGQSVDWLKDFNFPPVPHLTDLKFHFENLDGEVMITQVLKAYGTQIKTLAVTTSKFTSCFENVTSDMLPNLTNLKIRFPPERGETHVLNFLKNGNWPLLKQLTLFQLKSQSISACCLDEVMDVISKFASTLEVLHIYFPKHCSTMIRFHFMTVFNELTPERVAKELQMSVKLPFLQEFSLPYTYTSFMYGLLATSKFCEKAEALKTVHIYDGRYEKYGYNFTVPNYEEELNEKWWPVLSPDSKLERVIIFSGNEFDDNVVVHKVINKPAI